jgi:hypothetical protein
MEVVEDVIATRKYRRDLNLDRRNFSSSII